MKSGKTGLKLNVQKTKIVTSQDRLPSLCEEMATHFSSLAWEIPGTEEPGGLWSTGSQESDMTELLNHHHLVILRCADLESP